MENDNALMERGITSMVWRDSGDISNESCLKGRSRREKLPLHLGEYVWRYDHRKERDKVKMKRILKLLELEVSG